MATAAFHRPPPQAHPNTPVPLAAAARGKSHGTHRHKPTHQTLFVSARAPPSAPPYPTQTRRMQASGYAFFAGAVPQGLNWEALFQVFLAVLPVWIFGAITGYLVRERGRTVCGSLWLGLGDPPPGTPPLTERPRS